MNNYQPNSPVLLLLFNRPNETRQLLEVISKVKPKQLFISIDGPRNDNDKDQINKILDNISENINFDCDLRIQKQEKNLGCGLGPRAGISWFFENVEEGIIQEFKSRFHKLFNSSINNKSSYEFAKKELGFNFFKSKTKLKKLMGWDNQIKSMLARLISLLISMKYDIDMKN